MELLLAFALLLFAAVLFSGLANRTVLSTAVLLLLAGFVLDAGVPGADAMFHLVALVVLASILAHSSTDVPIAHAFARAQGRPEPPPPQPVVGEATSPVAGPGAGGAGAG
ncbi:MULTISPECIES: hypothetical protein [unclassified Blastococcus]